jgi:hypothetical protein
MHIACRRAKRFGPNFPEGRFLLPGSSHDQKVIAQTVLVAKPWKARNRQITR